MTNSKPSDIIMAMDEQLLAEMDAAKFSHEDSKDWWRPVPNKPS